MKNSVRGFIVIVAISLGIMMPLNTGFGDSQSLEELNTEWWQWAVSIPVSDSPLLDKTGEKCMVGQRGSVWFLGGNVQEGPITYTCTVPEGKMLFTSAVAQVRFNTPNLCGQGPQSVPVEDLRANIAAFVEGITELSVVVNDELIDVSRVQSKVFELTLPEENILDVNCTSGGPAGIYSPAVADGYYVWLNPLSVGNHTIRVYAKNTNFTIDMTYNLTVAPVSLE